MRLILMGPPGAGKGTQAKVIAEPSQSPAISTGGIFRQNVAPRPELGVEAQRYMEAGDYVPDQITNAMVRDRLGEEDAQRGFLLDGYPRTLPQVGELDCILDEYGYALDVVVSLTADQDELVGRLLQRAKVEGRSDDTEEVIRRRQEVSEEQTAPLISVYEDKGLLLRVDGMGEVETVGKRIAAGLDQLA